MSLIKWEPFREMAGLHGRLNRMFPDSFFGRMGSLLEDSTVVRNWAPVVDIYETENEVVLKAELPGMEKKDIHLEVRDHTLTLSGERKHEKEEKEENFRRVERSYGKFYRSFSLPSTVDAEKVKANMKEGVLEISLPKVEEAKPKAIEIESK
jgi:HSP20 family protein